jgi:hypothetical protein
LVRRHRWEYGDVDVEYASVESGADDLCSAHDFVAARFAAVDACSAYETGVAQPFVAVVALVDVERALGGLRWKMNFGG